MSGSFGGTDVLENLCVRLPRSSGYVTGAPGTLWNPFWGPRVNSAVFFVGVFRALEGLGGGACNQDSEVVGESFWDGQSVEIEARQFLTFRHGMT